MQDSWRVRPNLTVTVGLRYTILQTPYEVNGQQVAPTIDLHQWFTNRAIAAAQGLGNQPEFAFAPSGQSRGGNAYWNVNKLNFAPRLAVAYSPIPKPRFVLAWAFTMTISAKGSLTVSASSARSA